MVTNNNMEAIPYAIAHPLDILKDELAARGISRKEFANRIGMNAPNLSRMFREKHDITPQLAEKLEHALDINALFWLNLQIQYNKDVKAIESRGKKEDVAISLERMIASLLDIKTLYARLRIKTCLFVQDKLNKIYEALGETPTIETLCYICNSGTYKHSDTLSIDEKQMNTWTVLAYISARRNVPTNIYMQGNARKAAKEISEKVNNSDYTEADIHEILNKYGISYSVVEKLEKTPIDGYSVFMDEYPAIVTTHRHNDMSRLVFNIMHELGHIELHLKKGDKTSFVAKSGDYSSRDKKEIEANTFAEDMLIPTSLWRNMMNSAKVDGLWGEDIVKELMKISKDNNLNFGIVSWRYRYETSRYALKGLRSIPIR